MSREDTLPDGPAPANDFRWRSVLSWSLFVGLGLLVWELTDQTGLAASVTCLKFGLDETATGLYLLWHDPVRARGWTMFVFHLARGCGRFGLIGYLVSGAVELVSQWIQRWQGRRFPVPPGDDVLIHIGILGLCGIFLWAIFAGAATWYAWKTGLRLWIDPTTRDSRRTGIWPPQPYGRNRVRWSAIGGTAMIAHLFGLQGLAMASDGWSLLATIPASVALGWWVAGRISARTPEECWPPDEAKLPVWPMHTDSDGEVPDAGET